MAIYERDLAYVHHVGFGQVADAAARWLVEYLGAHAVPNGLVVDLACGSGRFAAVLTAAGYRVLGVDISPAMAMLARKTAPLAKVRVESLYRTAIPPCSVVTIVGEALNYRPGSRRTPDFPALFRRIHERLLPRGLLLFDAITDSRAAVAASAFSNGDGWAVGVTIIPGRSADRFTRAITTFRQTRRGYRRSDEVHELQIHPRLKIVEALRRAGFSVRTMRSYAPTVMLPGRTVFVARRKRISK